MVLIVCDIHRNILSVQSFIKYKANNSVDNVRVIAKAGNLMLHFYSGSSLKQQFKIVFSEFILQPLSVTSVNCQNAQITPIVNDEENISTWSCYLHLPDHILSTKKKDATFEMTFRFRVSVNPSIENYTFGIDEAVKFKDFMKNKYENFLTYFIVCTNCKGLLSEKQINFQSVKTYEERSSELAENWFCHKHNDHQSPELNENILYIGDTYFYFHDSVIKYLKLSENNKEYVCATCSSLLSLKRKINCAKFTGFFCDKILLQESELKLVDTEKYKRDIALFSLSSMFADILEAAISCKIYLQSKKDDKNECLLLWINSPKVAQFVYEEVDNENIPNEIEFKTKEVFKVLYTIVPSVSELSVKWQRDFSVDFLQVSDNTMEIICHTLKESSKYFPSNQDTVNEFLFGYLPGSICHNIL